MRIIVDAYTVEEQAYGWHAYLDDTMEFPFEARCHIEREESPLKEGETVLASSGCHQRNRRSVSETVEVTYHVGDVPDGGPALGNLQQIIEGTASEDDRGLFADVWHGRLQSVLSDDSLFTVTTVKSYAERGITTQYQ